jgi:uncharacterized repeat protein (TIGR01451 family)
MVRKTAQTLILATALTLMPTTALAAGYGYTSDCSSSYGSYNSCIPVTSIVLNKTVQDPQSKKFVENLTAQDAKYTPESVVPFKITVKNTGTVSLSNVTITDTMPQYLDFSAAPGVYDASAKTVTIKIDKLNPGEERVLDVQGKLASASALPANTDTTCLTNTASVSANGQGSNDTTQFCVQKPMGNTTKGGLPIYPSQPIATTPSTGPEVLSVLALIPSALGGLILRKKAHN